MLKSCECKQFKTCGVGHVDCCIMSALGQKRTFLTSIAMSALRPKADISECGWHVRYGPKADMAYLFDHLVGTFQQRRWDCQSERLGSPVVNDQLEPRCLSQR